MGALGPYSFMETRGLPASLLYPLIEAYLLIWTSQVALVVKKLPSSAGDIRDVVRSLGQEDPLEKGMTTHSSILPWRIPWLEKPGRLQSIGWQGVRYD